MKTYSKCPICGSELKRDSFFSEGKIEEIYEDCPICHYHYEYVYGVYLLIVGKKWFRWSLAENRKSFFKKVARAKKKAKKDWSKKN